MPTSSVHQFLETVTPQFRDIDTKEDEQTAWYSREGCKCELGPKKTPCCQQFPVEYYREMRGYCLELRKDILIMGQIKAMTNSSDHVSTENRHKDAEQEELFSIKRNACVFGLSFFLHATGKDQYVNMKGSCSENGIVPRVHGNTRRLPVKSLTFDDVSRVVSFISVRPCRSVTRTYPWVQTFRSAVAPM